MYSEALIFDFFFLIPKDKNNPLDIMSNGFYFYLILPVLVLSITSCEPPSTILVAETSVNFASLCKSGIVVTPQLHIVDLTL